MTVRKVSLTEEHFRRLYSVRRFLGTDAGKRLQLSIPFDVFFQDPGVAREDPDNGIDKECFVDWEPSLSDGPTSARFAVVDYDADTGVLTPPAEWDEKQQKFVFGGQVLSCEALDERFNGPPQFHQVHVWAVLQRALHFFEGPNGLGRRIPWAFEGNRLIVVPHAGQGKNAYYDRQSKSLQFYYFDVGDDRVETCLSTDIVHHEFAHAMLDGARPFLIESASVETAAFHEFMGDLTAILIALRNNAFRQRLLQETKGNLAEARRLSGLAEQFGKGVSDRPYLRTAINDLKMKDVEGSSSPHHMSQVLTGAMFDIILELSKHYQKERGRSAAYAFWDTIQRMQRTAIQPLDFLPPMDVTFKDYARAVLRADELANPRDPHGHRKTMVKVFVRRGILTKKGGEDLLADGYVHDRLDLDFFHPVDQIGASKASAYRFLDDNRKKLKIPANRDVLVADLYHADKYARQARRLPRQLILEYVWRQDVRLEGSRFGRLAGEWTSLLCGGTLVFDENGSCLMWAQKPGSETDDEEGKARLAAFLDQVARRVKKGQIGKSLGEEGGIIGRRTAPFMERRVDGRLRIEVSPHLNLSEDHDEPEGDRQWQLSS